MEFHMTVCPGYCEMFIKHLLESMPWVVSYWVDVYERIPYESLLGICEEQIF